MVHVRESPKTAFVMLYVKPLKIAAEMLLNYALHQVQRVLYKEPFLPRWAKLVPTKAHLHHFEHLISLYIRLSMYSMSVHGDTEAFYI